MKALVKKYKKQGLWMEDIPKPQINENEVLIKITKNAICGTDVHIYEWDDWAQKTIPVPMQIGHEFVGVVAEIGKNVNGIKVGERVSGEGHLTCGHCRNCRAGTRHLCIESKGIGVNIPGAFAEYLKLPALNVFHIPEGIPDEIASILDPFGNATHTALSFDLVGEDVLITGAGPIGILAATVARHVGARHIVITDVNQYRLDLARKMGIEYCLNIKEHTLQEAMKDMHMIEGFDVCMEMSGSGSAFNQMLEVIRPAGKIALLGILPETTAIPWSKLIFKGLMLKGIYGREMFETWYKMSSMLQGGLDISPIITHHFHIDDYENGFQVMREGKSGKVILNWE